MKNFLTLFLLCLSVAVSAATYRNYVGHFVDASGLTYTVYVNSDTAFGEDVIGQICYTPSGGGGTQFTGFVIGSFDNTSVPGANWKVVITVPAGATNLLLELANENQSNQQYGWTGCNIALSNSLPVELTRFTARTHDNAVVLEWQTASERDSETFEPEISTDGVTFKSMGVVAGAGHSRTVRDYSFTTETLTPGRYFFRLKMVNMDRTFAYSDVVGIRISSGLMSVAAQPNPVKTELLLSAVFSQDDHYVLEVFDQLGKLQLQQNGEIVKGENRIPVDMAGLTPGAYWVRLNGNVVRVVKD